MITLLSACLAVQAEAADPLLERIAPTKTPTSTIPGPADPEVVRQGGDTVADAVAISLPHAGGGSTVGYTDDYDEVCPYSGSTSPDVVYSFVADADMALYVDLAGSAYDTKVYVYDETMTLVACNDDAYPDFTSLIVNMPVVTGIQYYIVIDGYGGASGNYLLNVDEFVPDPPCDLTIPAGAEPEGEPPFEPGYIDCYNNGCQTSVCDGVPTWSFQLLDGGLDGELVFHGRSGWYPGEGGMTYRDGDYLIAFLGEAGVMEITVDAEFEMYLFEVCPTDCANMGVCQHVIAGPCSPNEMTVFGEPGQEVWLLPTATTFEPPAGADEDGDGVVEFDYLLEISGLAANVVRTEAHSWSEVKALYR